MWCHNIVHLFCTGPLYIYIQPSFIPQQVSNARSYHTLLLRDTLACNFENSTLQSRLTEKGITQGNLLNPLHTRIRHKVRINIEEDRHVNRLSSIQSLLLKAKALNLAKVRRHLPRRHAIRCHTYDIVFTVVRSCVEC